MIASTRTRLLTALALLAFAGNSLLGRMAFQYTTIDAASFTSIRLVAGALALGLIVALRGGTIAKAGSWAAAIALFTYAASFSAAYVSLPTGVGALLLFGAVQITMIGYGLGRGERLSRVQVLGMVLALGGLVGLLLPGLASPPLLGSLLMLCAGAAWGVYSLLGKGVSNPTQATAGNFLRAVPITLGFSLLLLPRLSLDSAGVGYAIASGALTSGVGYALWYNALPGLEATQAAIVQLCVPVLAAIAAILLLNEPMTLRLGLASAAVLGGIALVLRYPSPKLPADRNLAQVSAPAEPDRR